MEQVPKILASVPNSEFIATPKFFGQTAWMKQKVLFVCIHNSARSQMAEAFLNATCPERFLAQSAGIEPGKLNPTVVRVMSEAGIDISHHKTKAVADFLQRAERFDYVITVCDETSAERCPAFPGQARRLHWGFPDPSSFAGPPEEKLARTRQVRDAIKTRVESWCAEICGPAA
jgi:arsenate reductase